MAFHRLVVLASLRVAGLIGQAAGENEGHKLKKVPFSLANSKNIIRNPHLNSSHTQASVLDDAHVGVPEGINGLQATGSRHDLG